MEFKMSDKLLKRLDISREDFRKILSNHIDNDMSLPAIADLYGVSATAIFNWCKKFGLKRRQNLRSKEWLYHNYIELQKPSSDIAAECGVTYQAVMWHLKKFNIPKRTLSEAQTLVQKQGRRSYTIFYEKGSYQSRGYCFWYGDFFFFEEKEKECHRTNK